MAKPGCNLAAAAVAALLIVAVTPAARAEGSFLERLERKPLPEFKPPDVEVKVLSNGMRCFLLEDHTLPAVTMRAIVRTGDIYDPADKVGLAALTGNLLRSGGAGSRSPQAFDAALDDLGAVLTSSIGREMGKASLEVLSSDLEEGARLFFDMLFAPRLDAARLGVARLKIEEELRREDDDPSSLASRLFRELVYGEKSPWARRPTAASLRRITADDVRAFHGKYYRTDNVLFVAAGDFKTKDLLKLVEAMTKEAPRGEIDFPTVASVKFAFDPKVEDVVRPISQAFIRMGHLGIKRHNPDKYALFLMTEILGAGNFKSRLMEDIRTQRGLAYSVWGDLSLGMDYGLFVVGVTTKSSQAGEVIGLVRRHIDRMSAKDDVTDEELEFAKQSLLARLVFEFDSAFKVADHEAQFFYYGYPKDYWKVYRDQIAAVTKKDIRRVAEKYLHPDGLAVVVVGPRIKGLRAASSGQPSAAWATGGANK